VTRERLDSAGVASIDALERQILESIDSLTPAEKRVARAILASYPASATRSSSAIAEVAESSPASVVRFVNKLGFTSLREFQEAVRSGLEGMYRSPYETLAPASSEHDLIEAVIKAEASNVGATLNRLTPESIRSLRQLLVEASSIAVMGGRFSHALAVYLHAHLRLIRSGAVIVHTADVADEIAHVGRGTLIVIFDFRRYHPQAEFAARYVKARRGKVVVVTDVHVSPAAQHADHTLVAEVEGPHLVESYASVVALLDMIIGDLVATNSDAMRRRIDRVEVARSQLDDVVFRKAEALEDGQRAGRPSTRAKGPPDPSQAR
jgi:DNA-binding MurR/RpiR family transcriptional regulator